MDMLTQWENIFMMHEYIIKSLNILRFYLSFTPQNSWKNVKKLPMVPY